MSGRHLEHLLLGASDARGLVLNRTCAKSVHAFSYVGRLARPKAGKCRKDRRNLLPAA